MNRQNIYINEYRYPDVQDYLEYKKKDNLAIEQIITVLFQQINLSL